MFAQGIDESTICEGVDHLSEVSDAGKQDRVWRVEIGGLARELVFRAEEIECVRHRIKVPRPVIDNRDHRSAFVLGSSFDKRRSREQAARIARAQALKIASI